MLIAARFSGSGSGKDLLSLSISLIASGLLPFSSFPIPVAPDSYRGRDRPACRIACSKRDGSQGAAAVRSDTRNLARASLVTLSSIEGLFFDRSALGGEPTFGCQIRIRRSEPPTAVICLPGRGRPSSGPLV